MRVLIALLILSAIAALILFAAFKRAEHHVGDVSELPEGWGQGIHGGGDRA